MLCFIEMKIAILFTPHVDVSNIFENIDFIWILEFCA